MGSVKDLIIIEEANRGKTGKAEFVFSNRYSVFDWGEMPDYIENKGKSLCMIGSYFFEKLNEKGINNHYIGIVKNGKIVDIDEIDEPTDRMRIKLLRVLKPKIFAGGYDYSIYSREKSNFLIPIEVIYRNFISEGSSLLKRLREGIAEPEDFGLNKIPEKNKKLERPIFEFSTKLEFSDRYITREEVKRIAMIKDEEIDEIIEKAKIINEMITKEVEKLGLKNEDGKIEFGFDEKRNIVVVDVVGTPDECRFTVDNIPAGKEVARIFYRKTEWYKKIEEAKKMDKIKWKEIAPSPPSLPEELRYFISSIYQSICNGITKKKFFMVKSLNEILREMEEFLNERKLL